MFAMVFQIKSKKIIKLYTTNVVYYTTFVVQYTAFVVQYATYVVCISEKIKANFKNVISTWNFEKNLSDSKNINNS